MKTGVKVQGVRNPLFGLISSKLSLDAEGATEEMVKRLYFLMLSQKSDLESQISSLEATNVVIRAQNEGLCNQVASLCAGVVSLEQGLKAAQNTTPGHESSANEVKGLAQHGFRAVRGPGSDKEQGNGASYNRQIARPNLIVVRGKSLMEVPSPNAQPGTARSFNTDTMTGSQHTSQHSPAPQLMPTHRKQSAVYLKPLTSLKTPKQLRLLMLLRSFGIPWDSYISRISKPSANSTKRWISVQQRASRSSNLPNHSSSTYQPPK